MKNNTLIFVFMLSLSLMTCNHEHSESEQGEAYNDTELQLDGEKKWEANQETTEGVNSMIGMMNAFDNMDDVHAYAMLSQHLKSEFELIFERCTMKGESHHQLHNFLIPIHKHIKGLNSGDLEICRESFNSLDSQLSRYEEYFQ